jgi:hypothetical protein
MLFTDSPAKGKTATLNSRAAALLSYELVVVVLPGVDGAVIKNDCDRSEP